MSRIISFTANGWEDYLYWQSQDKQILKKINRLIKECQRDPFIGSGKPEPLRHELSGTWSRRVNDEDRLVYIVFDQEIRIMSCRYHY
jgi:toxin YoeB